MTFFFVVVSLLLESSSSVRALGLQINGPECGMPTRGMIVNGTGAETNQFPWMVFLRPSVSRDETLCGGSIITKRHILTAAQCMYIWTGSSHEKAEKIKVFYGNNDWTRGKVLMVTKIMLHPKYQPGSYPNDIAILEVGKPFRYGRNVRPVCLPAAPMDIFDTEATVAGWGMLKEGGQLPNHLQYANVRVLPNELCSVVYFIKGYVSDSMYCTYRKGTDSCQGDTGGPLMSPNVGGRYVQVGIISSGLGCARKYIPRVHTRVEAFMPWIKQVVGSLGKAYANEMPLQLASYDVPQWPSIFQFP